MQQVKSNVVSRARPPMSVFRPKLNASVRLSSILRAGVDLSRKAVPISVERKIYLDAYLGMCFHTNGFTSLKENKITVTIYGSDEFDIVTNNSLTDIKLYDINNELLASSDCPYELSVIFDSLFKKRVADIVDIPAL